ncbi:hypothetical protein EMMF5_000960 [Cystobasidiomycetes sp. EMM_F5]
MKFTTASAFAILSAFATGSFAAPAQPSERAGPSGHLSSPAGGTTIQTTDTGNGGIWMEYIGVNQNYGNTYALTYSVAAFLVSPNGQEQYFLTNGEAVNPKTGKINAFLKTPRGACGDFDFVIVETQYYRGQVIDFKSQAPRLHINCAVTP